MCSADPPHWIRQFEGTLTYGTKCAGCKNKTERPELFNELEISLKAGCKLEDRIAQSLESERLTDDNQCAPFSACTTPSAR